MMATAPLPRRSGCSLRLAAADQEEEQRRQRRSQLNTAIDAIFTGITLPCGDFADGETAAMGA